jgi:hypothetical protein
MIRSVPFAIVLAIVLFVLFIGAAFQPDGPVARTAAPDAPADSTAEFIQRASDELAAWPSAAPR